MPSIVGPTFGALSPSGPGIAAIDPADYPSAAAFRFEVVWRGAVDVATCARLYDVNADAAIAGSDVCNTRSTGDPEDVRIRSAPIVLPAGEHEYTIQGRCDLPSCSAQAGAARIIVEWTE